MNRRNKNVIIKWSVKPREGRNRGKFLKNGTDRKQLMKW